MQRLTTVGIIVALVFGITVVAGAEESRRATAALGRGEPSYTPAPEAILINEGFETSVPPPTWTWQGTHTGDTTWYQGDFDPYSGAYNAEVLYDPALIPQDEWLVSEPYALASGTLSFWSLGSIYWCRDDYDNCDLEVWLVVGPIGGGDDILLGTADGDWVTSYVWAQTSFVLDAYLPLTASIGFRYVGTDGAQVSVDEVVLDGELVPVELQSFTIE